MKFGPGPRGYLGTIGQYALGSGASFGFFMSIGSCIRNEEESAASNLSLADKKTLNQKFRSSYYHHNNNNPNPIAAYYYNPANNMNSSPSSS
ncbi:subunit of TIM23 translocase complex [Mycoemilia scoparia]|uniref:Subunit of TIM23 translocase complex n=1 Tax=Mycoemilia scoparia TaxID=417184 RepID=A0A9W7ZW97_9FUNG|nr:subunit of TIM23 translocase complex [Mycoemilia scoparia]